MSPAKTTHIDRLQEIVQLFREIEPTMNMNEVQALTIVAQRPGVVIDHIREDMGDISASSVSRIIDRLSDRTNAGMGLVTKEETMFDASVAPRKTKAVYLTTKGQALLNQVANIMK